MAQPTYLPLWATDDTTLPATGETNKVRPREVLRSTGWDMGQIPTCEEWNWMFNNVYLWIQYLSTVDGAATSLATANTLALRDDTGSLHFHDLYVDNNLEVDGSATISQGLTVTGTSNFDSTANFDEVIADSITTDAISINGNVDVTGSVLSSGDNTFSNTNTFSGELVAAEVDINGGNIDGTVIGETTQAAASVTSLSVSDGITGEGANTFSGESTFSSQLNLQSSNLSTNGYTYLPNGVIMQWGYVAFADMTQFNNNEGYSVITLPKTFPNALLSATCTVKTSQPDANSDFWGQITGTPTTTQITVQVQASSDPGTNYLAGVYWTVIGH